MSDERKNNGGSRAGAGRKTKLVETDLLSRLKRAIKGGEKKDALDEIFSKLIDDCQSVSVSTRHAARKLFLNYYYGKPVARHELTGENGGPIKTVGMSLDEWRKNAAERTAQAAQSMEDFEGDDA